MYKRIKLSNNYYTLIDEEDSIYNKFIWKCNHGYASRSIYENNNNISSHSEKLHRLIMNITDSNIHVDHINGNRLDNRKCNLRLCTNSENTKNKTKTRNNKTSKYKGVHFDKQIKKFVAQICNNHQKIVLGSFVNELDAANAYDNASIKYHKEFGFNNNTKIDKIEDWSIYEELPRALVQRSHDDIEVWCSNGKIYKSIEEAALDLKVKNNTIIKACTDTTIVRRVRGFNIRYTGNTHTNIKIYDYSRK